MDNKGEDSHRRLTTEELLAIAWLRTLSEDDRERLPSVLAMFKQSHHSLDFCQTHATANDFQQRLLCIA